MNYLLVFLGGGLGSVCRFGIGNLVQPLFPKFPFATLLANGLACLVLGVLAGFQLKNNLSDAQRLLFAAGFCGGFSTFSTFTSETFSLFQNGQVAWAVFNVLGSLALCFFCFFVGLALSKVSC